MQGQLRKTAGEMLGKVRRSWYRHFPPLWKSLEIDLHSNCNRDCDFCPRYGDRSGIRKDANGDNVKQSAPTDKVLWILDQARDLGYRGRVRFHRLSEPLLDPRFPDMVSHAVERGMRVHENTNGDVLRKNPDLAKKLDGLVERLTIGIYDSVGKDAIDEEKAFFRSLFRKTALGFSHPLEYGLNVRPNTPYYDSSTADYSQRRCDAPAVLMLIRYDGEVHICCQDDGCSFQLGNAFNEPLEQIWWSEKRTTIARTLSRPGGRRHYEICRDCKYHGRRPEFSEL